MVVLGLKVVVAAAVVGCGGRSAGVVVEEVVVVAFRLSERNTSGVFVSEAFFWLLSAGSDGIRFCKRTHIYIISKTILNIQIIAVNVWYSLFI